MLTHRNLVANMLQAKAWLGALSDGEEISLGTSPLASNRGDLAPRNAPNGILNIADVLVLNRILLGDITASPAETTLGDLNDSGSLDVGDQVLLLRMVTGEIPAL